MHKGLNVPPNSAQTLKMKKGANSHVILSQFMLLMLKMKPLHLLPNLKMHLFYFFQYWTSRKVVHLSYGPKSS